jgi:phosphohistidine phosphatase
VNEALHVLVVRHAIAERRDPRRWPDDSLRPLTRRGERRFQRALGGMARLVKQPSQVWTSPLRRATQTAALGGRIAGWPQARVMDVLRPGVPPREVGRALQACRANRKSPQFVVLVGHEPGLGRFIAWCVGAPRARGLTLRKGGAALLRFDAHVDVGGACLEWLAPPKLLRGFGRRLR